MNLLLLNPITDEAEDEADKRVHRVVMLLASESE